MKNYYFLLLAICTAAFTHAQMSATFDTTVNTICDGSDCQYSGPSIMINEIMVSPVTGDGSLSGNDASQRGEWIELYNPNLCEPVDISCYYLGSAAPQSLSIAGEGFQLPSGTIVPPGGFCVVRGVNAEVVPSNLLVENGGNTLEIIVPGELSGDGICIEESGGLFPNTPTRLWFPNAGGWFAFYDADGVPQDAISWGNLSGVNVAPCVAEHSTCGSSNASSLASYNDIPTSRKEKIYNGAVPDSWGKSVRRIPDGGAWQTNSGDTPTEGDCNDICEEASASTCDGTATVTVTGGASPYSYVWDDSEGQLTQTATGLCAGTYTVTVTDQNNDVQTFTIEITDLTPDVDLVINDELCNYGQTVSIDDIATYSPTPGAGQTGTFTGTGVTGTDFDVSVSGAGTFPITYTFTDENACHNNSDVAELIIHESPNAQISNIAPEYCIADSIVEPVLSPIGGILTGPGISNDQFSVNDAGVGTHIIKYVVENEHGCKDSIEVTVIVHSNPTFDLSMQQPNCGESDGEIIITPNAGSFPYVYSIDDGDNVQNDSTFVNLSAGAYDILVTDVNGCISAMDTTLSTFGANDPSFTFADFCEGDNNGATNIATQGGEFSFNPPANDGATINPSTGTITNGVAGTTYTVQHVTTGICADTATVNVTVHSMPNVSFDANHTEGMPPLVVTFTNNSTGADNYTWNFGDGSVTQNNSNNVTHSFNEEGVFTTLLTGETNNGMCVDTATIKIITAFPIIVYEFPNVFTPNGDHQNDNWTFVYHENVKKIDIIILNRWGNLVFESNDVNFFWNGKVKNSGAECVDGTYFYKAKLENYAGEEVIEHGFIHLIRD